MTREEAIQIIRDIYHTDEEMKALESLIPELRESEDERIRKALIKLLTVASEAYLVESTGIKKDSYLAYLEKQKEQKPAWSEEDEKMRNLAIEWAETMSGQISFVDMNSTDFRKIIAWLKSLRPSWKPSDQDELMKLKYAGTSTKLD